MKTGMIGLPQAGKPLHKMGLSPEEKKPIHGVLPFTQKPQSSPFSTSATAAGRTLVL